jgi:hypothetical protein
MHVSARQRLLEGAGSEQTERGRAVRTHAVIAVAAGSGYGRRFTQRASLSASGATPQAGQLPGRHEWKEKNGCRDTRCDESGVSVQGAWRGSGPTHP